MTIEPLYRLRERLYQSMVAGISIIEEDFRLKQAIKQIESLTGAAPVFLKIYQGACLIFEVSKEQRADVLLDEIALIDAVLVTQAEEKIEGEISSVSQGMHSTIVTDKPCSQVAPLIEALMVSGNGHYSFLLSQYQKYPKTFQDSRLKAAMVKGLGAKYAALADQIEKWLGQEDDSWLPFLKIGFDPKGKKEMARRVRIVKTITKEKENHWYLAMLKEAASPVREELIDALQYQKENKEFLFQLAKTEKGKAKKIAIKVLAWMDGAGIYEFFQEQLQKNEDAIWQEGYFELSKSEAVSDVFADWINYKLDLLEARVAKGKTFMIPEECWRWARIFQAINGKTSDKMIETYKRLADTTVFFQLEEPEKEEKRNNFTRYIKDYTINYLEHALTQSIVWTRDQKLYKLTDMLYKKYGVAFVKSALIAALLTKDAKTVFDEFSSYLTSNKKLETKEEEEGRHKVMEAFLMLNYWEETDSYLLIEDFTRFYLNFQIYESYQVKEPIFEELDIRWIALFTDKKVKKDGVFGYRSYFAGYGYSKLIDDGICWDNVLEKLVRPNDERSCRMLGDYFCERAFFFHKHLNPDKYYPIIRKCHSTLKRGMIASYVKHRYLRWEKQTYSVDIRTWIWEAPMSKEDKRAELDMIQKLIDKQEIVVNRWTKEEYECILKGIEKENC